MRPTYSPEDYDATLQDAAAYLRRYGFKHCYSGIHDPESIYRYHKRLTDTQELYVTFRANADTMTIDATACYAYKHPDYGWTADRFEDVTLPIDHDPTPQEFQEPETPYHPTTCPHGTPREEFCQGCEWADLMRAWYGED